MSSHQWKLLVLETVDKQLSNVNNMTATKTLLGGVLIISGEKAANVHGFLCGPGDAVEDVQTFRQLPAFVKQA